MLIVVESSQRPNSSNVNRSWAFGRVLLVIEDLTHTPQRAACAISRAGGGVEGGRGREEDSQEPKTAL